MMTENNQVLIYTDGACSGNPGPGGYGIILKHGSLTKEQSGGFKRTTNNRMEIIAAIIGLESLKAPCKVSIYSDSQYLVKAMNEGWARRWKANSWKRNSKDKAVNPDLWDRLLKLCDVHKVEFIWVRGHNEHPENERCDKLATTALTKDNLPPDTGYGQSEKRLF